MNVQVDRTRLVFGLGVFLVCLLIRFVGIGWGLPTFERHHSLHPDEELILAYSQAIQPAQGKFTPGFYNYGTLYLTIQKVATDVASSYAGVEVKEDGSNRWEVVRSHLLAGRVVGTVAGALAALAVYLALIRHTSPIGAVMGGLAMGLTPGLVVHSRFQTVDVLATCFLSFCFYQCSKMVPVEGDEIDVKAVQKAALLAGVFAGLSAATKYTGVLALFAIVATLYLVLGKDRLKDFSRLSLLSVAALVGVFILGTPGSVLDSAKFMQDFQFELTHTSTGHGLVFAGTAPGFVYHLSNLIVGYGGALLVFSIAGLGRGMYRKQAWLIGPVLFALVEYMLIGRAEVKFLRYTFPLIPVLAMGYGWGIGQAHKNGSTQMKAFVAFAIFAIAGFGGGLASTAMMTKWMVEPDVRDQMASFVKQNLPEGASVGLVSDPWFYTPTLYPEIQAGPAQMRITDRLGLLESVPGLHIIRYTGDDIASRQDWDPRLITESKPDFILFSSFEAEGYVKLYEQKSKDPEFASQLERYSEFVRLLNEQYEMVEVRDASGVKTRLLGLDGLLFTSGIHDLSYIRPQEWIWIRKGLKTGSNSSSTTSASSGAPLATPSNRTEATSAEQPSTSPSGAVPTGGN